MGIEYYTFEVITKYRQFQRVVTSSTGNSFLVTVPLRRETTGHRWIPLTEGQYVDLMEVLCPDFQHDDK